MLKGYSQKYDLKQLASLKVSDLEFELVSKTRQLMEQQTGKRCPTNVGTQVYFDPHRDFLTVRFSWYEETI